AFRPRLRPRQSFHSTPARATCAAQDSRQSLLCGQSTSPAHTPQRFPRPPAALPFPNPLPDAATCRHPEPSRLLLPAPRAVRLWQSRRLCSSRRAPPRPAWHPALPVVLPPLEPVLGLPSSASFQSRSCRRAETPAQPLPASFPTRVVPTPPYATETS